MRHKGLQDRWHVYFISNDRGWSPDEYCYVIEIYSIWFTSDLVGNQKVDIWISAVHIPHSSYRTPRQQVCVNDSSPRPCGWRRIVNLNLRHDGRCSVRLTPISPIDPSR